MKGYINAGKSAPDAMRATWKDVHAGKVARPPRRKRDIKRNVKNPKKRTRRVKRKLVIKRTKKRARKIKRKEKRGLMYIVYGEEKGHKYYFIGFYDRLNDDKRKAARFLFKANADKLASLLQKDHPDLKFGVLLV